ncbi:hypothetical protein D8B26_003586 [Coccidioides posadasii str. Silveira]|uniref:uncharacterized protein n=1 Tax=Coccidioides posadasii (strain RMSCC 757 / Silveira) TaxID=443226 RepID=UPI001BEF5C4B|nr:hypothetical protein D8B26_003586 [Coccidioides posadasii str. Silveira]
MKTVWWLTHARGETSPAIRSRAFSEGHRKVGRGAIPFHRPRGSGDKGDPAAAAAGAIALEPGLEVALSTTKPSSSRAVAIQVEQKRDAGRRARSKSGIYHG